MALEKLELGNYYHIEFKEPWKSKLKNAEKNIVVVAKTNRFGLTKYGVAKESDIKTLYFDQLNLPINFYITNISDNTEIFVCKKILSFDPLVESSGDEEQDGNIKNFIFYPITMIDLSNCDEFYKCKKINYDIKNIIRRLPTLKEESEFLEYSLKTIKERLSVSDIFFGEELDVNVKYNNVLVQKTIIDNNDNERESKYEEYKNALLQNKVQEEYKENLYLQKLREIEEKKSELNNAINDANIAKNRFLTEYNNLMTEKNVVVKMFDIMRIIVNRLISEGYEVPTFEQLYQEALNQLNNG